MDQMHFENMTLELNQSPVGCGTSTELPASSQIGGNPKVWWKRRQEEVCSSWSQAVFLVSPGFWILKNKN